MKNLVISAFLALTAVARALITKPVTSSHTPWSNGTHFIDQATNQTIKHFNCDVHQGKASAHFNKTVAALHQAQQQGSHGTRAARAAKRATVSPPLKVPVYFHILYKSSETDQITQQMVNAQIQELNTAYNPYGVSFNLKNTSWTANDAWAVAAGSDMDALKQALRVGTYSDLNLYFHTDLSGGNLGTCTLPSQVEKGTPPSEYYSDGCNINANTMPGGTMGGYNLGKTAVHETGHWLGLLHTFEGYACTGEGDYIADTPLESQSTNGCPSNPWKDSCPKVSGVDPIHNYMDYSTDACYVRFTPNQVQRIQNLWQEYRAGM